MDKPQHHHPERMNGNINTSAHPLLQSSHHDTVSTGSNRPNPKPVQAFALVHANSSTPLSSSSSSSTSGGDSDTASGNFSQRTGSQSGEHSLLQPASFSLHYPPHTSSSSSSSAGNSPPGTPQMDSPMYAVVCSRCHQQPDETPFAPSRSDMVSFGTNLYYCRRCAKRVGFLR